MWLDIGNNDYSFDYVQVRMNAMLDIYGVFSENRDEFAFRIIKQMDRVGAGIFPTEEQTMATRIWVSDCQKWLQNFISSR